MIMHSNRAMLCTLLGLAATTLHLGDAVAEGYVDRGGHRLTLLKKTPQLLHGHFFPVSGSAIHFASTPWNLTVTNLDMNATTLAIQRHCRVQGPECDEWSSVAFETTRGRKMQYIKYKGKQAAVPPATDLDKEEVLSKFLDEHAQHASRLHGQGEQHVTNKMRANYAEHREAFLSVLRAALAIQSEHGLVGRHHGSAIPLYVVAMMVTSIFPERAAGIMASDQGMAARGVYRAKQHKQLTSYNNAKKQASTHHSSRHTRMKNNGGVQPRAVNTITREVVTKQLVTAIAKNEKVASHRHLFSSSTETCPDDGGSQCSSECNCPSGQQKKLYSVDDGSCYTCTSGSSGSDEYCPDDTGTKCGSACSCRSGQQKQSYNQGSCFTCSSSSGQCGSGCIAHSTCTGPQSCTCNQGYETNFQRTACVIMGSAGPPCPANSRHTDDHECTCDIGYHVSSGGTGCIRGGSSGSSCGANSYSSSDGQCTCNSGYIVASSRDSCTRPDRTSRATGTVSDRDTSDFGSCYHGKGHGSDYGGTAWTHYNVFGWASGTRSWSWSAEHCSANEACQSNQGSGEYFGSCGRNQPLCSTDCKGMCGPSCSPCWPGICGDCCNWMGCYAHDSSCSTSSTYFTADCIGGALTGGSTRMFAWSEKSSWQDTTGEQWCTHRHWGDSNGNQN